MKWLLDRLHYNVGLPWAWAIVGVTVLVRMALVPLTVRQIHSMQNLQRHAPQMKEIQKKYKGDRQRMNEELMKFYKENNINPAASCLPMLAQFPVFIALYFVLRDFSRHVPAGSDLSWLGVVPSIAAKANSHWSGYLLLVDLRGQPDRVDALHVDDDGQDAAGDPARPPPRLHLGRRPLPGRSRPLLDDDQPVDGRPGSRHPPARAEDARAAEAGTADARAPRRRSPSRNRSPSRSSRSLRRPASSPRCAASSGRRRARGGSRAVRCRSGR